MNTDILNTKNGFNISHLNICSLKNKVDMLKITFENLNQHIITLSETWLTDIDNTDLLSIDGYSLIRLDRNRLNENITRGGGLAMYIKDGINFSMTKFQNLNRTNEFIELQSLYIKNEYCKDLIIFNIYRPPSGNIIEFIKILEEISLEVDQKGKYDIFMIGDYNINGQEKIRIIAS